MSVRAGIWTNDKRRVTGHWSYHWPSDRFIIELKSGSRKVVSGEHPEWGKWKLVRDADQPGEKHVP